MIHRYAQGFFDACESGKGANATANFTAPGAPFGAQVTDSLPGPKLSGVKTVAGYADWMAGVVQEFGPKATYEIKARAVDMSASTALYFAVFAGLSEYVYALTFDESCKISSMRKVWNDG